MANPPDSSLMIVCPQCQAKLKANASLAGTRIQCPKCQARVLVPGGNAGQSEEEDWFSLEPVNEGPYAGKPPTAQEQVQDKQESESPSGQLGKSVFDDDLPDLAPLTQPSNPVERKRGDEALEEYLDKPASATNKKQGSTQSATARPVPTPPATSPPAATKTSSTHSSSKPPSGPKSTAKVDEEYSVTCKVCGTLLSVTSVQSGKKIRCPDCHSDLVIPAPPAKKKQPDIQLDDQVASVRLSPVEGTNPRLQEGSGASAKTMLAKAAKDLEVERAEIDAVTGVFDSKAWLSQIFSFLSDRRVVIALVALGVVAAGCEYAAARFAIFPWLGKFILFPAYAGTFLCCLGVLPKAANRADKVEEWPFSHLGTYVGPMFVVLILWYVTYFIGWGIAAPFSGSFAFIREAIAETFQWGVLPILFIGILDTRSPIQPISMKVLQSMGSHSEAWGAMYMQTAMAWVGYFLLRQIGLVFSPQIAAIFGICLPLYLCFVANQYGILAARISDVTDLGFSGEYAEAE